MFRDKTEQRVFATSIVAALLLAALDLGLPTGFGYGFSYVLIVPLSLLSVGRRSVFATAAVCTVLALLGYTGASHGLDSYTAIGAHVMSIAAIWSTAFCCFYCHQLTNAFDEMLATTRRPGHTIDAHTEVEPFRDTLSVVQLPKDLCGNSAEVAAPIKEHDSNHDIQSVAEASPAVVEHAPPSSIEREQRNRIDELSNALSAAVERLQSQSDDVAIERTIAREELDAERACCADVEQTAKQIEADFQARLEVSSEALSIAGEKLEVEESNRVAADQALSEFREDAQRQSDEHERELAAAREQITAERTHRIDVEREAKNVEDILNRKIDELTNQLGRIEAELQSAADRYVDLESALNYAEERKRLQADELHEEFVRTKQEAESEIARCVEATRTLEGNLKGQIDDLTSALATAKAKLLAENVKNAATAKALAEAESSPHEEADEHARDLAAANQLAESAKFSELESQAPNERSQSMDISTAGVASAPHVAPCLAGGNTRTSSADSEKVGPPVNFISELYDRCNAIRATLRNQDFEELETLARDLVTPAEQSGYDAISQAARDLEVVALTGRLDELTSQVDRLRSLCELGIISHSLWSPPPFSPTDSR